MNGYTFEQFLDTIKSRFDVALAGVEAVRPQKKGEFGMYADGNWYRVNAKADLFSGDPVKIWMFPFYRITSFPRFWASAIPEQIPASVLSAESGDLTR